MHWDIIKAKPEQNLTVKIQFYDGTIGRVIFKPEHLTGVFEPLKDPKFFEQVFIDGGTIAWPGEVDLAPDALYQEIKKHGNCVLR